MSRQQHRWSGRLAAGLPWPVCPVRYPLPVVSTPSAGRLCEGCRVFSLRFAMRTASKEAEDRAALYGAALDMCSWAETRGAVVAVLSQHHRVDDGYLPSPLMLAAAIAARTATLPITIAALLIAYYEPIKLAEDMAVLDLISRGRTSYVIGIGYRQEEFDLFGVDRKRRAQLVEDRIGIVRALLAGSTVEIGGRTVSTTPTPFTLGGPFLAYGGGTEAAARRAGRLGMVFIAETHNTALEDAYRDEATRVGVTPQGCVFPSPGTPLTVFVSDDPARSWAEIGEYLLRDAVSYGQWNAHRSGVASISTATSVAELRAEQGAYQIITPDEARSIVEAGGVLALQPLVGGLPPELAWPYLESAADACRTYLRLRAGRRTRGRGARIIETPITSQPGGSVGDPRRDAAPDHQRHQEIVLQEPMERTGSTSLIVKEEQP